MELDIFNIIDLAKSRGASDVHLAVGCPVVFRIDGSLIAEKTDRIMPPDTQKLLESMLSDHQKKKFEETGEIDFSFSRPGIGRFRANAFRQRGSVGFVMRIIASDIPSMEELGLPLVAESLCKKKRGLILVTGPTGSGKTTTLASMVAYINKNIRGHIITIEDPVEYLHRHDLCIVNQREVGQDTLSFASALRVALREDPDIILVGEMRDLETISTAITSAETGHLVMSTLHTIGASKTIDRIIDVFPPYQQHQVRIQLATSIEAIISQQLLPKAGEQGRIACFEILLATPAVRALIREGKTHLIPNVIQTSSAEGMVTMDNSILSAFSAGLISQDTVRKYCVDLEYVDKQLLKDRKEKNQSTDTSSSAYAQKYPKSGFNDILSEDDMFNY